MSQKFLRIGGFDTPQAGNNQGVATDANYVYVSEGDEIMKYDRAGTFIQRRNCAADGTNNHLGGLIVIGSTLYVTTSAYPATPYNMYVKEYNASTFAYVGEHFIHANYIGEDIEFKDNRFWFLVDNEPFLIHTTDANFANPIIYPFPNASEPFSGNNNGWNGTAWKDDVLYANTHGGTFPDHVQKYSWDGTAFTYEGELLRPYPREWNGQGMHYDEINDEFWFAGRSVESAIDDSVTRALLVDVDPVSASDDRDAYKNSGVIQTDSLIFSGNIAGGGEKTVSTTFTIENPDFFQVMFDNNRRHSGKFKNMMSEMMPGIGAVTKILETTFGSYIDIFLNAKVNGNVITITGTVFNPDVGTVTLQGTTLNLMFIPYEATI
jgi:hypothetical protein